jgi:hypothetical protein
MKPKEPKSVVRGCLEGVGPTLALARQDLETKITDSLEGSYGPMYITYRSESAIVYRTPMGWEYSIIHPNGHNVQPMGCTCFVGDYAECVQAALFHVIQNGVDVMAIHAADDLPSELSPARRTDLADWCRWQRAARSAMVANEPNVHAWACDHQWDECFA